MNQTTPSKTVTPWTWAILLVAGLMLFLPLIVDHQTRKNHLRQLWEEQGRFLADILLRSGNILLDAGEENSARQTERMLENVRYFYRLDSLGTLDNFAFRSMKREERPLLFELLDENGQTLNRPRQRRPFRNQPDFGGPEIDQFITQSIAGNPEPGQIQHAEFHPPGQPPAEAFIIRRSGHAGYIFMLFGTPPGEIIRHRLVQHWLGQILEKPQIEYLVLTRGNEVLVASFKHQSDTETGLRLLPAADISGGQLIRIADQAVFDYSRHEIDETAIRIGFSTQPLNDLNKVLLTRLIIQSILFLLIGGGLLYFFINRQNYSLLRKQYRQLQGYAGNILEEMAEGILVLSGDEDILAVNSAFKMLFNLPADGTSRQKFEALGSFLPVELSRQIKNRNIFENLEIHPASQPQRTILATSSRIKDQQEKLYLCMIRDITSQKEIQDQKHRHGKLIAMGELASRVAHEIRNPLNGIGIMAQRLRKEFYPGQDGPVFEQMTGAIRDETRRINTIIENFLSYARTPGFHFEKTNLDQFILQNLPALRAVPGLNLTTFIPEKIQLTIDHDQIMQVLINLLRNSAESRSGVVEVIITAQEKDGRISLIVQDDGPGIPAENQDKVFDLYFTGKEMGNGLGLAIVEKIISAHGGRVRIQSPVKNEAGQTGGTAVILDLPGEVQVENE